MAKPIENTERISTYLSSESLELLQNKAKEKGMTVSGYIRMLIIEKTHPGDSPEYPAGLIDVMHTGETGALYGDGDRDGDGEAAAHPGADSAKTTNLSEMITQFKCPTRTIAELARLLRNDNVRKQRGLMADIDEYCNSASNKILGIFGLRRTGKSVLLRSKALDLLKQGKNLVFFDFELDSTPVFSDLICDLKLCKKYGVEYVFIDELTFLKKEIVAELSGDRVDVPEFPSRGMEIFAHTIQAGIKCIVSGTDSYCLSLAYADSLFERMRFIHTTCIPYAEYIRLMGNFSVLEFIRTGGILPKGDAYNWGKYAETAIIDNIIRSIKAIHPVSSKYAYVRYLHDDEIRSLIIYALSVQDLEFIDKLFSREYWYPEFSDGIDFLEKLKDPVTGEADPVIFSAGFKARVKAAIREKLHLSRISDDVLNVALAEMEDALVELDVITAHSLYTVKKTGRGEVALKALVYAISIPGLRAYQFDATMKSVRETALEFESNDDRELLLKKIAESAEGHLLEKLILSETSRYMPDLYNVSTYRIFDREVDLVAENLQTREVSFFEIKRSEQADETQAKHFTATPFLADYIDHSPGALVKSCNVIYNGVTQIIHLRNSCDAREIAVNYINAAEYLKDIGKWL